MRDALNYPFPNFSGCTGDVWEWISYFISNIISNVITFPCLILVHKVGHWYESQNISLRYDKVEYSAHCLPWSKNQTTWDISFWINNPWCEGILLFSDKRPSCGSAIQSLMNKGTNRQQNFITIPLRNVIKIAMPNQNNYYPFLCNF